MQQTILDSRYELERLIGEGGMARVYAGRDLRLNRRVAIKIPHSHYLSDPDFLSRFRHEAQAAAMLTHPNIVDVYDVGQDGDIHYLVMEYVEGTNLKTIITHEAPLPIARAVDLAAQIAHGLHAAHRAGLIHRDIKPQNIIVTPDGQAHITDFGVAKSPLSTALTETGVAFGTVDYLSPEQAQGRPATPLSDVYALGVVLYEMLTGRLPFTGDNALAVAMKHVTEPPAPPRQLVPGIPPGLEALVLRAMAKDPAQRPASALEFAEALRAYDRAAQQETLVAPGLSRPAAPLPRVQNPGSGRPAAPPASGTTGRVPIPPPRGAPARAPSQDGIGCGVFVVGLLVLAGVLGLILLISTGAVGQLFAGWGGGGNGGSVIATPTPTPETGTPTPTPQVTVVVPDLSNYSGEAADQLLRQASLQPVRREAHNAEVAIGLVISQDVPAGSLLPPGSPVTYTVSLGPQLVELPNVTRIPAAIARDRLTAQGLRVEVREEPSREVDAGFVISQSPNAGLSVPVGSTVTIVVSRGDVVRFPNVIGLQRDQAEQILRATPGLTLIFVDEQGPDRLPGYENYADNEVVSAQIENGPGILNGDYIPRGSNIILGVKRPG
ncbi:MAG: Stk1 family PASTA domain-containing Ser/Thr kinase [Oscillochloridaceae bacterium]|nr:Stk1 family PASTA domain-containing Ser/Thr kinase [Chloroflexaceae bacterium]MDW8391529.1 Stk1 family PASTA domain-containing Ser/Thr kinase [Oscillochloridaceae bacterium]